MRAYREGRVRAYRAYREGLPRGQVREKNLVDDALGRTYVRGLRFWKDREAGERSPTINCGYDEGPMMNKTHLKKFKDLLEEKREEILKRAAQTLSEDMTLDQDDLPDEMDLASSEYLQSFTFRLRGREKVFLDKIQKALDRIEDGSFGNCEECGEEISLKRLEARPETTLCIRCKEDQERVERDFG